jgi:hypothetical protein
MCNALYRCGLQKRSRGHDLQALKRAQSQEIGFSGHDAICLGRHRGFEEFVVVGIATGMEGAADCSPLGDSLKVSKNFAPTLLADISVELRPLDADRQLIERGVGKNHDTMLQYPVWKGLPWVKMALIRILVSRTTRSALIVQELLQHLFS